MKDTISIVISAYNEEGSVEALHKELTKVCSSLPLKNYELIFVDDGSKDQTYSKCQKLQEKDAHVKIVHFMRNFGHEIAMTAGMDYAKGDAVIFMDADFNAEFDVDVLSAAFNMEKADFMGRLFLIDDFTSFDNERCRGGKALSADFSCRCA